MPIISPTDVSVSMFWNLTIGALKTGTVNAGYEPFRFSADGCNDWFIDPIAVNGLAGQAIGRLVYFTKRSSVNEGDYYFGFHFHLTRP